ncbi:ABC-type multidrug transport system ATPase subunit [Lacibacter cauensis]|uniref:ABC-type multidrug transport system ATPase subunit n=1 Tax=Lacibacter cauensis TaxID=510947 RepID=A0A562SSC8_9BACT|nr:ABC transporter ATP-binding protein [Lacibacter cauensis]TWI83700.1 ABC-type multidrug transport system ATPase subunit [Lacibacter cauensis]
MKILLSDAGKRYNREWIFRHVTYEFNAGEAYAVTGNNGSGKSTLLQIISGAVQHSEGTIEYNNGSTIAADVQHRLVAMAAPYLELPEEMTLEEFLTFHQSFKTFLPGLTVKKIIALLGLEKAAAKQIRYFSSGMKQRVKLAQAILSDVPVVLLDEPCTNLDADGISLYHRLVNAYCADRLVIVSSNDEVEYNFCQHKISIMDYKQ